MYVPIYPCTHTHALSVGAPPWCAIEPPATACYRLLPPRYDGCPVCALPLLVPPPPLSSSETRARALQSSPAAACLEPIDPFHSCMQRSNLCSHACACLILPASLSRPSCHYNLCKSPEGLQTTRSARSIRYAPSIVRHALPAPPFTPLPLCMTLAFDTYTLFPPVVSSLLLFAFGLRNPHSLLYSSSLFCILSFRHFNCAIH